MSLPFPAWLRWVGVTLGAISLPLLAWVQAALDTLAIVVLYLRI